MLPARWTLVAVLLSAAALHLAGQEPEKALEFSNKLYPIATGYQWQYRVTDLKAPKSTETAPKQLVTVTVGAKQAFALKKKSKDGTGTDRTEQVYGYELQTQGTGKPLVDQVLVSDDGVYNVSSAGKVITPPLCVLKAGAAKGMAPWKCDSQSENAAIKGEFVVDQEDVQLPAGIIKDAIVVRSRDLAIGTQKMQVTTWYKENLGVVKKHVQVGNHDVIMELEKFERVK